MHNPRNLKDKELLAIERELDALNSRRGIVKKLHEPLQRGWVRYHVLSERALRHRDQRMLAEILAVIGTKIWNKSLTFREWKWPRGRRRHLIDIEQPLKAISASEWQHKNYPDQWRRYFLPQLVQGHWGSYLAFVCDHVSFFELKCEPLFVDELVVPDPVVAQRIAELESRLYGHNLMPRLSRLHGHSRGRWKHDPRYKIRDHIAEREIRAAHSVDPEAEATSSQGRSRFSLLIALSPA